MIKTEIEAVDIAHEKERGGGDHEVSREGTREPGRGGGGTIEREGPGGRRPIAERHFEKKKRKRRGESNAHIDKPFILLAAMPRRM
jgi:hypothetical protein